VTRRRLAQKDRLVLLMAVTVAVNNPPCTRFAAEGRGRAEGVCRRGPVGRGADSLDGDEVGEVAAGSGRNDLVLQRRAIREACSEPGERGAPTRTSQCG